ARQYCDWRMFTSYFDTQIQLMPVAVYVIENSIAQGLQQARISFVSMKIYWDLKRNIGDGILALTSRGGDYFRSIPDYHVEFDGEGGVPTQPPRPTNPGTVIAASISEQRLSLGDKKDIGFVYEDYGAQNTEISVTI